jgi:hypothetical protein
MSGQARTHSLDLAYSAIEEHRREGLALAQRRLVRRTRPKR